MPVSLAASSRPGGAPPLDGHAGPGCTWGCPSCEKPPCVDRRTGKARMGLHWEFGSRAFLTRAQASRHALATEPGVRRTVASWLASRRDAAGTLVLLWLHDATPGRVGLPASARLGNDRVVLAPAGWRTDRRPRWGPTRLRPGPAPGDRGWSTPKKTCRPPPGPDFRHRLTSLLGFKRAEPEPASPANSPLAPLNGARTLHQSARERGTHA